MNDEELKQWALQQNAKQALASIPLPPGQNAHTAPAPANLSFDALDAMSAPKPAEIIPPVAAPPPAVIAPQRDPRAMAQAGLARFRPSGGVPSGSGSLLDQNTNAFGISEEEKNRRIIHNSGADMKRSAILDNPDAINSRTFDKLSMDDKEALKRDKFSRDFTATQKEDLELFELSKKQNQERINEVASMEADDAKYSLEMKKLDDARQVALGKMEADYDKLRNWSLDPGFERRNASFGAKVLAVVGAMAHGFSTKGRGGNYVSAIDRAVDESVQIQLAERDKLDRSVDTGRTMVDAYGAAIASKNKDRSDEYLLKQQKYGEVASSLNGMKVLATSDERRRQLEAAELEFKNKQAQAKREYETAIVDQSMGIADARQKARIAAAGAMAAKQEKWIENRRQEYFKLPDAERANVSLDTFLSQGGQSNPEATQAAVDIAHKGKMTEGQRNQESAKSTLSHIRDEMKKLGDAKVFTPEGADVWTRNVSQPLYDAVGGKNTYLDSLPEKEKADSTKFMQLRDNAASLISVLQGQGVLNNADAVRSQVLGSTSPQQLRMVLNATLAQYNLGDYQPKTAVSDK